MKQIRRIALFAAPALALAAALAFTAGGCNQVQDAGTFAWQPLFGDGKRSDSPVAAEVAGVVITEHDIDLRYDELPDTMRRRYAGDEGRRLLLSDMINQVLLVRGAVDAGLYNRSEVARTIISQRREALELAMRYYGLEEASKPTETQIREWFDQHRDKYRQAGTVRARHIECATREQAQAAFERLGRKGAKDAFPYVCAEYSLNAGSKARDGELGWFNRGGFQPDVVNSALFTTIAYDLPDGLNPPVKIEERWHVIEILDRTDPRPMTYAEARDMVLEEVQPSVAEGAVRNFLAEARVSHPVQLGAKYAPGGGLTADQIFARAVAITEGQTKLDMFNLLIEDFPEDDRIDDALFLSAQVYIDSWQDLRSAGIVLKKLIKEHPDSEYLDDARYMLDNLGKPQVLNPTSIDDLRQ